MRRRLLIALSVLAVTVPVFFLGTSAAYAAGPCSWSSLESQGYYYDGEYVAKANGGTLPTNDAVLEVWARHSDQAILFRAANLVADGKTGVLMKSGTSAGANDLGASGSIGSAPNGGWCANPHRGTAWGYLGFYIGGRYYATGNVKAVFDG